MTSLVLASPGVLNQLYASLCSYSYTTPDKVTSSPQTFVNEYLESLEDPTDYSRMVLALDDWLLSDAPSKSIGLTGPGITTISGLRVQIIEADGTTAYDSSRSFVAGVNYNVYTNINKPRDDFLTSGKYKINENQGTRSYNMGAFLATTGTFIQQKYSKTIGDDEMYYAVRQGLSSSFPEGNIVISMHVAPFLPTN